MMLNKNFTYKISAFITWMTIIRVMESGDLNYQTISKYSCENRFPNNPSMTASLKFSKY